MKLQNNRNKRGARRTTSSAGSRNSLSRQDIVDRYDSDVAGYQTDSWDQYKADTEFGKEEYPAGSRRNAGVRARREPPRKKDKGRGFLVVLLILLLAVVCCAVLGYIEISGHGSVSEEDIVITVPEGASTAKVSDLLKEYGLIGNPYVFRLYSRLSGSDGTFQMGNHVIAPGMTYNDIILELQKTTYLEVETITVTFPEGTTALRMALMLEEEGICSVDAFIEECNTGTFDVSFFADIPDNTLRFIKLEGYLYPDTYEFVVDVSIHDAIQQILENFETKVLTQDIRDKLAQSEYTLDEILTLASVIQKESFNGEERNVSAVFHNRLNIGMALESDTSRDESWGGYIPGVLWYYYDGQSNVPQGMCEAYDTYKTAGLIIGAICNPGLEMIDAALDPTDSPYYYFFTTDTKDFIWSETYSEHVRKWRETHPE